MLEYVMSGTGHTKIHYTSADLKGELQVHLKKYIGMVNNAFPNQKMSMLYNAYQEKTFGVNMKKYLNPYEIHADSGGLQMLTGNKKITDELKNEVYKHQAHYSTVAMSFDDIPVKQEGKVSVTDMSSRLFDLSLHKKCAISSAKNIMQQIECFNETGSASKVMAIIQGNCVETLVEWCDTMFDVIPKEYHKKIHGISVSGAVMGGGQMEDIEKIFSVSLMNNCPANIVKNLHLLGIGSYKRLIPATVMRMENVIVNDTHISYDSTSHTSGLSMGRYFYNPKNKLGGNVDFGRSWNKKMEQIYNDLENIFGVMSEMSISNVLFTDVVTLNSKAFVLKHGSNFILERHIISFLMCLGSVYNFMECVNIIEQKKMHYEVMPSLYGISNVKSLDDFKKWKSFSRYKIKSSRVETTEKTDLSTFI